MTKRRRRWPWVLLGLLVVLLGAKYFLLDTAAKPGGEFTIDLAALHQAATSGGGTLPERIEVERVGTSAFPRPFAVAGDGFRRHKMVLLAPRIVWPDRSVMVDTAMSPAATAKMPGSTVDAGAYDRVVKAMQSATAIVFSHEHPDHVGG